MNAPASAIYNYEPTFPLLQANIHNDEGQGLLKAVFHLHHQSKSRLVRTSGATRVHTYSEIQIQLDEIFTHTDGHLLVIVS